MAEKKETYALIIVGVGGTGSRFFRDAAQYLAHSVGQERITSIHLFDGDEVEEKNLRNQGFMPEDIGLKKAAVLAEVYSEYIPVQIHAHCEYLTSIKPLLDIVKKESGNIPLILGCIDNHGCRLLLEEFFNTSENCILFDSGNEFSTGEVVYAYKRDGKVCGPPRSFYFPDILKGDTRNRDEISCEELNVVAPQHFQTNGVAGQYLLRGMIMLLDGKACPGFQMFNALEVGCDEFIPLSRVLKGREASL